MPSPERPAVLLGFDPTGLDPDTIDPRKVGPVQALLNFVAFIDNDMVKQGLLSPADAACGFDEFAAELESMVQPGRMG